MGSMTQAGPTAWWRHLAKWQDPSARMATYVSRKLVVGIRLPGFRSAVAHMCHGSSGTSRPQGSRRGTQASRSGLVGPQTAGFSSHALDLCMTWGQ